VYCGNTLSDAEQVAGGNPARPFNRIALGPIRQHGPFTRIDPSLARLNGPAGAEKECLSIDEFDSWLWQSQLPSDDDSVYSAVWLIPSVRWEITHTSLHCLYSGTSWGRFTVHFLATRPLIWTVWERFSRTAHRAAHRKAAHAVQFARR
jgi:hypothetical protein